MEISLNSYCLSQGGGSQVILVSLSIMIEYPSYPDLSDPVLHALSGS